MAPYDNSIVARSRDSVTQPCIRRHKTRCVQCLHLFCLKLVIFLCFLQWPNEADVPGYRASMEAYMLAMNDLCSVRTSFVASFSSYVFFAVAR